MSTISTDSGPSSLLTWAARICRPLCRGTGLVRAGAAVINVTRVAAPCAPCPRRAAARDCHDLLDALFRRPRFAMLTATYGRA
ncbi:hypothetical protein GCM10009764_00310 [Nocardia ninae]|uniref:Uncharacterized protein n=1 Tax=Nocardia ninae NBRC 108245 TaxID=1210091 RepID=A0A511MRC5_9NOCA|nr:hypothetical protein NN4_72770 [Nocardia ninae NBRC 108245]